MSKSIELLAHERGRLLERIAHQRSELGLQFIPVQKVADKGDRAIATVRSAGHYLQAHRAAVVLLAGVAATLWVVVKPGRAWRLARRGFVVWRSWRAMRAMGLFVPGTLWGSLLHTLRQRYL